MMKTGFASELINPPRGASLAGYFNPRPNRGPLDNLMVRTVLFEDSGVVGGIVCFDLCFVNAALVAEMKKALAAAGVTFADRLIFAANHTHTGPNISDFFGMKRNEAYCEGLVGKTVSCVRQALADLSDSELAAGSFRNNPFAFNRRFFMKDGKVLTNPGKLNPDIVRPEGPVDDEIGVLAVRKDGDVRAIVVNIVNHTDTIGGDMVSADWPGFLERALGEKFGHLVTVVTLVGCSGNINHFDVSHNKCQGSYEEARRIGEGYADLIFEKIGGLEKVGGDFRVDSIKMPITAREISDAEAKKAKDIVSSGSFDFSQDLTSEDIVKGTGAVAYFFAKQLLEFKDTEAGKTRVHDLLALKFGKSLAISSLPGEPFTEIGMEIKKKSPFKTTFVASLGMDSAGYIPMRECFERGGYEILPVQGGGCSFDAANTFIENSVKLLAKN